MNSKSIGKGEDITQPGDSIEQRQAEKWLLDALSRELEVKLTTRKFELDGASYIQLDGYCESPPVLCEAWSHIGPPKSGQKHKVMTDAFKLLFTNEIIGCNAQCILLFADRDAAEPFIHKSWMAQCIEKYGIKVRVIEFPPEIKAKVLKAQERQCR